MMGRPKKKPVIVDGAECWKCSKCKELKPGSDFSKCKITSNGLQSSCRSCQSDWNKANAEKYAKTSSKWRENNRERLKETARKWREANVERRRETNRKRRALIDPETERERAREWRRKNPDASRASVKRWAKKNKEYFYRLRKSEVGYARKILNDAVRLGKIIRPTVCERCNKANCQTDGHHEDYSKPLDVDWLCKLCHGDRHREIRAERRRSK